MSIEHPSVKTRTPKIKIACVIPTYNRGTLTHRAVESVLMQSDPVDEIIVVDDGSTDNTRELLSELPINYIYQSNNGGASARNFGMRATNCDWIAFLDSDDVWDERHIERMRRAIVATDGQAALYFSDVILDRNGETGRLWEFAGFSIASPVTIETDGTQWGFLSVQPMMLQASVVRRAEALELGGLDHRLYRRHDTHFFFKMCIGRPICAVEGIGACMSNQDPAGRLTAIWGSDSDVYLTSTVILYRDVLKRLPKLSLFRREVWRRLASAHRQLARAHFRERFPSRLLRHTVAALRYSPLQTAKKLLFSPRFFPVTFRGREEHEEPLQ